jgi:hypothetical protein
LSYEFSIATNSAEGNQQKDDKTTGGSRPPVVLTLISGFEKECHQHSKHDGSGDAARCGGNAAGQDSQPALFRNGGFDTLGQSVTETG